MSDNEFAPIFKGWNVWIVQQKKSLGFDPLMLGVSRETRLKIWVEDQIRLHAPGAEVADPIALKGSMIERLQARPQGLKTDSTRDQVPGDSILTLDGPVELAVVRFFNRGAPARLLWPHDDDYLLDEVLAPDEKNPSTAGPGPKTTTGGATEPIADAVETVAMVTAGGIALYLLLKLLLRR